MKLIKINNWDVIFNIDDNNEYSLMSLKFGGVIVSDTNLNNAILKFINGMKLYLMISKNV